MRNGNYDDIHQAALDETGFWGRQGAGVILFSPSTQKIGLGLRSEECEQPGTYGSFGGAIDADENIAEAIEREVFEEIGYVMPLKLKPLAVFKDSESDFAYQNYLLVIHEPFVPELNWEVDEIGWFSLDELINNEVENLHFGVKFILEDAKSVETITSLVNAASKEPLQPGKAIEM